MISIIDIPIGNIKSFVKNNIIKYNIIYALQLPISFQYMLNSWHNF